ncbi:MAG: SPFH domain-containing protein [Erysipelotrichaceae bacterium]|nr:SPFH domain-containing protein [Erysipelotrichaceae bacterium]
MGLITAIIGAANSTFADQWKEYFYCDALEANVLVKKGQKRITSRSSNTRGNDNIISNGSGIVVADGQCMIIVEQGKIVEFCAEPGQFTWDASSEPSLFTGSLGKGLLETFKTIGKRFTYGGDTGKDQRVYYFNIKEIVDNKFGTATPIPFKIVDRNINLDFDTAVRCNGIYSYKLSDPLLFYKNVCGNVEGEYRREKIDNQLKTEFIDALQPAFGKISELNIRPSALPSHVAELKEAMNVELAKKWADLRGLTIVSIAINSVTIPDEDAQKLKDAQFSAINRDPSMAAATLVGAKADAMRDAANNSAGAMTGFMGMGMAMNQDGTNAAALFEQAAKHNQAKVDDKKIWVCSCGAQNDGKFCTECGKPKPVVDKWICVCGTENTGKFCTECGKPKPVKKICPNCGAEVGGGKFCPECGQPLEG